MFKVKELLLTLPDTIIITSKDNEIVKQLENGKHGRSIFSKSIAEQPLATESKHLSNIKSNINKKKFGKNAKSVIAKKGFDKYGVDTGETYNNLQVRVNYLTKKI